MIHWEPGCVCTIDVLELRPAGPWINPDCPHHGHLNES